MPARKDRYSGPRCELFEEWKVEGAILALREVLEGVLRARFETVPNRLQDAIDEMDEIEILKALVLHAAVAPNMKSFRLSVPNEPQGEYDAECRREGLAEGELIANRESLVQILRANFGSVPKDLQKQIRAITDVGLLEKLIPQAVVVSDIQTFRALRIWTEQPPTPEQSHA